MSRRAATLPVLVLAALFILADRADLPVVQDGYVSAAAPSASYGHAGSLSVASGGLGYCAPSEVSYLRFDLSRLAAGPVREVALLLEATYAAGSNSGDLVLYAAPDSLAGETAPWQEAALTWSNRPTLAGMARLASIPVPVSAGTVRLESQPLAALVNQEASFGGGGPGDDVLSLALQIEGCTGLNSVVRFASSEVGPVAAPALTFSPPLKQYLPLVRQRHNVPGHQSLWRRASGPALSLDCRRQTR